MKDAVYVALLLLLLGLSGERERDLRRRLEEESVFVESLATEFELQIEKMNETDK